jgi:hypothetical protein
MLDLQKEKKVTQNKIQKPLAAQLSLGSQMI